MIINVLLKIILGNGGIASLQIPEWVIWVITLEAAVIEIMLLYKLFTSI